MTETLTKSTGYAGEPLQRRGFYLVAGFVALCVIAFASYLALASYFLRTEAAQTPERAQFFASSIDDALTRLEHLPYVLSIDETTLAALVGGNSADLNPILADIATRAGAEFVYVLDIDGKTIASSNYQDTDSLVDNYYTFRPYFRDALSGGAGRYYAVGVTTGRPGYFIAEPIRDADGTIHGVVTVKIGFDDLSRALSGNGELVLVADEQGVVLASSNPELIYGYLSPLSDVDRRTLEEQQQFGDQMLFPLDWLPESERRARLDGTAYVWTTAFLEQEDWSLHLLSEVRNSRRQALLYVAGGLMTLLLLTVAASVYRAAQLRNALALSNADRNRLTREIEERRIAEKNLNPPAANLPRKNSLPPWASCQLQSPMSLGNRFRRCATTSLPRKSRPMPNLTGFSLSFRDWLTGCSVSLTSCACSGEPRRRLQLPFRCGTRFMQRCNWFNTRHGLLEHAWMSRWP